MTKVKKFFMFFILISMLFSSFTVIATEEKDPGTMSIEEVK